MGCFSEEHEVYEHVGHLLAEVVADDELGPRLCRADTVVRYELTEPTATITVVLPTGGPGAVEFGRSDRRAEVTMEMSADVAHRVCLGEVNLVLALARGQAVARGPVDKLLRLVPLAAPASPRYRRRLPTRGREDPVAA